ncbi:MAG: PUR family DNA/RNA-binding protein [Bacteroidales bacterium]|nr:PUR family DNA/RNA-binding protein [Bacteroidales bacterium]
MDGYDKKEELENNEAEREEIFSKVVRAGKRTYFLDVKATRRNDYYLTITESKKRFNRDGRHYFEKHKIFLYKEDFEKFADNLTEVIEYIKANAPEPDALEDSDTRDTKLETETVEGYSSGVDFDDLSNTQE